MKVGLPPTFFPNKKKVVVMINRKLIVFFLCVISILGACQNQTNEGATTSDSNLDLKKITTEKGSDQTPANQAKEKIIQREDIKGVRAVNTEKELLMAIEVPSFDRFRLPKIEKDVKKALQKQFSNKKIAVSTDQKIYLELGQLEKSLQKDKLTEKETKKKLTKLKKLMKEQS